MSAPPGVPQASHVAPLQRANLDWQQQALCREVGPELFFPGKGESELSQAAKKVCEHCQVVAECLEYAVTFGDNPVGVWGGKTEQELRKLRAERRRIAQERVVPIHV
jgi:WhiB family transcriptional regulator, redox-sensing transcriptional regulator